jgi:hypothetical protein
MTGFMVLTLRLLLGILTLKVFVSLAGIAAFIYRGYEQILRDSSNHFFIVFGQEFLNIFIAVYILLPIVFDALNRKLNQNTLKVIGVKFAFLLIFALMFHLIGLTAFIINTDWKWIGILYGYMLFLYFGILGELKPVLFLEEPRYFLIDLRERSSARVGLQFLAFFVFMLIASWNFGTESAIAQAQNNLVQYLN